MRVILGLAALAATATAQTLVTPDTAAGSAYTLSTLNTQTGVTTGAPNVKINVVASSAASATIGLTSITQANTAGTQTTTGVLVNQNQFITSTTAYVLTVNSLVATLKFTVITNAYTAQMQYKWQPNAPSQFAANTYVCDPCTNGNVATPLSQTVCDVQNGPKIGAINAATGGFPCASLTRLYTMTNVPSGSSSFTVEVYSSPAIDNNTTPLTQAYTFNIVKTTGAVTGDPQIVGMQGQDFQVHGVPDEIFNIVTYPTVQINARFTYLESGACHDNFTACFAHPGTYISEEGIRIGADKVRVSAGSFKKGLTVHVNGKKVKSSVDLKNGAIELVNHRRVVVHTDVLRVAISNSDMFLNQEVELMDDKLVALGAKRVTLKDNERFHSEVPLHGLQGQTWRNVEYPSGLEYEGSIMDYHVVDGNLFGTDFVFNQFQS